MGQFIDTLVLDKGLTNLEPEVLDQVKVDLHDALEDRINATILANLPESKLADFDKLLDAGDDKAIYKFCQDNIENLDAVMAGEFLAFRNTYLG